MNVWMFLSKAPWQLLVALLTALIAVLVFLAAILLRARRIDLPFMHVFLTTVRPRQKAAHKPRSPKRK